MYYLGVDGGGTKTSFLLVDEKGNKKLSFQTSTCHIAQVGIAGMRKVFNEFFNFLKDNKIDQEQIFHTFLGIPGYSEIKSWDKDIKSILEEFFSSYTCENDVVAGWAGSLECNPGINLVSGTGAIALGVNSKNETYRTNGWGYFCGDEGSAFWFGKKGIEIFSKQADSRYKKGPLYTIFKEELKLENDFDIINLVHNVWNLSRTQIAQLSPLVIKSAIQGDFHAKHLIEEAAFEMALSIKGISDNLSFDGAIPVSYSGGIFNIGKLILQPLERFLKEFNINYSLITPSLSPSEGSALYAAKLHKKFIEKNFIENLKLN